VIDELMQVPIKGLKIEGRQRYLNVDMMQLALQGVGDAHGPVPNRHGPAPLKNRKERRAVAAEKKQQ